MCRGTADEDPTLDCGANGGVVTDTLKTCVNCDRPLADRVEEEERTGTGGSLSTGECDTYRIWFCVNKDCVMYNTDLYREQIAR